MLTIHRRTRLCGRSLAALTVISVGLTLASGVAGADSQVTAIVGLVRSGANELALHSKVADNETLETKRGGGLSLLLGNAAVVQFGSDTKARVGNSTDLGPSRVEISQGEMKAVVSWRPAEDPFEIHTPALIATLYENVVHVAVDPATGETTLTCIDKPVLVASRGASKPGALTLSPGEQLVIAPGEAPTRTRQVDLDALAAASSSANDSAFQSAAIQSQRNALAGATHDRLATLDVPSDPLPRATAGSAASRLIEDLAKTGVLDDVCDPVNCNPIYRSTPAGACDPNVPQEGCI